MKTISLLLAGIALGGVGRAQLTAPVPLPAFDPPTLDKLAAPIALYPDALISLILPAATDPADLAAADSYLSAPGNYAQVALQGWDASVESLAHYPTLVAWLDQNRDYAGELGAAFEQQPQDLMTAIQRLRQKALASGLLTNTAQQIVFSENGQIVIASAQADTVYIPQYDPTCLYTAGYPYPGNGWITWGSPYAVGPWLDFGCDWAGGSVWIGSSFNHRAWVSHRAVLRGDHRAPYRGAPVHAVPVRGAPVPVPGRQHEHPNPGWGDRDHDRHPVPHPSQRPVNPNEPAYRMGTPHAEPMPGRIASEPRAQPGRSEPRQESSRAASPPTESRQPSAPPARTESRASNDNKDRSK